MPSGKTIVGSIIIIASLVAIIFFSGALNNIGQNYSPSPVTSPTSPPTTTTIAITGKVVVVANGTATGENTPDMVIHVTDPQGNEVITDKPNASGCFSFDSLPQHTYNISITVPNGYIARSATSYSVSVSHDIEFKIQNILSNPKTVQYHYTLRGVNSEIAFTVYGGLYNYLVSSEDSTIYHYAGQQQPSPDEVTQILTLRYVNESIEKGELHNLARAIEDITPNEDDQARIAISLVQNIPYDRNTAASNSTDWKYPYEILYSDTGVCSEKSRLLVCLLRELGYGCAILDFSAQNHQAVGISCPSQYAYYSGYAFVESTTPSIITDCYANYVGVGKLPSNPGYIIVIQDGKVMNSVSEEYQDNQAYQSLINMGSVLDESHYAQWQGLVSKYGLQVS